MRLAALQRALLAEVTELAAAESGADLRDFRDALSERRRPVEPPAR